MKPSHKIIAQSVFVIVVVVILIYIFSMNVQTPPTTIEMPLATSTSATSTDGAGVTALYTNNEFGFSLEHPGNIEIETEDANEGKEIFFSVAPSGNALLVAIGTQDTFRATPMADLCDSKDGKQVMINGVTFYSGDVSSQYTGQAAGNHATEYCTIHNNIHYKLVSLISYDLQDQQAAAEHPVDPALEAMINSFKFTK